MCNSCREEIINIQTGEKLDLERVELLKNNKMLKVKPDLFRYWNFEKNIELGLDVYEVTYGTSKKAWFYCEKCDDSYPMSISKKVIDRGCSICSGYYVTPKNSFGGKYPELAKEWHPTKNERSPYECSRGSGYRAWWICPDCNEEYDMTIDKRTGKENAKCPYCRGLRVSDSNCLGVNNPKLASQWHPTKNGLLTPYDVPCGSKEMVWWLCPDCDEETFSKVSAKKGCAVCAGQKPIIGISDMWTTNPELASLLANPEDGYGYMEQSNQKVDWKCPCCSNIIENKNIADIYKRGLKCPRCDDGLSFGEKFMYTLLKELNVIFSYDQTQKWSNNKRYDFYISRKNNKHLNIKENLIVEIQGEQHSNGSFSKMGGRSLEEEIENDNYKRKLALNNQVREYIEIESKDMNFETIKINTLNSRLAEIFNIDEDFIDNISLNIKNKLTVLCWDLWNQNNSVMKISEITSLSKRTVTKYLKLGASIGRCDYTKEKSRSMIKRKVVKLTLNGEYVEQYNSVIEASRKNNGKTSATILGSCNNPNKTAYGYIWRYLEDYENSINQNIKITPHKNKRLKEVVQLNDDFVIIDNFSSITEAYRLTNINTTSIIMCCKGRRSHAGNFRWMYKSDYDKFLEQTNKGSS